MKRFVAACLSITLALGLTACGQTPTFAEETLLTTANGQAADLVSGTYDSTVETFDKTLANQLDAATLQAAWESITLTLGDYVGHVSTEHEIIQQYFVVTIIEAYQESGVKITFSYNDENEMVGINFNYQALAQSLVTNEVLEEVAVTVGDTLPLDGILTLPVGVENPPVVLLVHGSGASDKNETIFLNTPFQDIAYALAEQGIASLRYDKRYYTYPALGADVTLEDEALEDVSAALALLGEESRIDSENIFVLGHSLGGGLTPYIAYSNPSIKGIISMAGILRPLYEISYDQNKAIEAQMLTGDYDESELALLQSQMEQVEQDIITLRGDFSELPNSTLLMGLYAGYQKSVKEYAGENFIDEIDLPILVLQGSADFQVSATVDYPLWQQALAGRENAQLILYDNLNHLMMQSDGSLSIAEYQTKGTVSQDVTDDIAAFVLTYAAQ